MMAVSTAVMWSVEELGSETAGDDVAPPGDPEDGFQPGTSPSVIDIATAGDDPEGDDYDVLSGTVANDSMIGTGINEFIDGLDGDDTLTANAGNDVARGGEGDDRIGGDDGNDTLRGNAGDDSVSGDGGHDRVYGHEGHDVLSGGAGDDVVIGGEGEDILTGGNGDDALHGYLGNDELDGGAGGDTLFGGHGDDTLTGVADDTTAPEHDRDYLNGGGGGDQITLGAGDIATGGNGADDFMLGGWLDTPHQGQIIDFMTSEDSLVVLYDDTEGSAPEVTIERDAAQDNLHRVLLEGKVIAQVTSDAALTMDHVTLIAQSAA